MRALTLVADRKVELVERDDPPAPGPGEVQVRVQSRRAEPHRRLGLPRHGLRQAPDAARGGRRGRGRGRRRRPRRHCARAGRSRRDVRRADLRRLQGLPRGPRQSVRERERHHGLSRRRLRAGTRSTCPRAWSSRCRPAWPCATPPARRSRSRPSSTCCSTMPSSSPAKSILVHAGGSGIGTVAIQMAKSIGCTVITTVGDDAKAREGEGARRRPRHQLPPGPVRGRRAQDHRQEGRRRRVRARRRGNLQRLAALAQARRPAGHLRRDLGADRHLQPDAAVPAAIPDHRLVRRLDAQYPRLRWPRWPAACCR